MKFLPNRKPENTMLVNIDYHRPSRDTEWVDYLDIIYKDLDTQEKFVKTIEKPTIEIYFAKEQFRNVGYNRSFIEIENTDMHECAYKDLPFYIAKQAGDSYVAYAKDAIETRKRKKLENLHKYKHVFGSDYDIANWYKIQWFLHNNNDRPKVITKQYLDIEVDGIEAEGFPRDGECPINAVTIVDEELKASYTFLLRNEKNPQIQEFEDTIDTFTEELHEEFDEVYGKLTYQFYMYDENDELNLLIDMFKLINTLKRDFLLIWNMGFDIPYIIARFKELGVDDPSQYMCHKDFPIHEMFYYKDNRNFKVENKGDYFKISSYTTYLDQMISYAGLRKGGGELRSLKLNAVAQDEIGDEKLDYGDVADIKTLPYVDYKRFVRYNIKDVLLQMGIERKTSDVENLYMRSYANATSYNKIFKQTIFLKNRAYIEYYNQGLIIGNNINIEYGLEEREDEEEDEKFDGALVADPTLNEYEGIVVSGKKSMYVYDNVVDMDFSSMYPYIIIAFNIAPNTMVGKLIIGGSIEEAYNAALELKKGKVVKKEDPGKDFVDNMLTGNILNMGSKWFNLPSVEHIATTLKDKYIIDVSPASFVDNEGFEHEPIVIEFNYVN